MNRFALFGVAALALAACSTTATTTTPTATAALTTAQIAAFAVESGYTVAARAELAAEPKMTSMQVLMLQKADQTAYTWAKTLATEAQAGNVIAADLTSGQTALAALQALVPGATP